MVLSKLLKQSNYLRANWQSLRAMTSAVRTIVRESRIAWHHIGECMVALENTVHWCALSFQNAQAVWTKRPAHQILKDVRNPDREHLGQNSRPGYMLSKPSHATAGTSKANATKWDLQYRPKKNKVKLKSAELRSPHLLAQTQDISWNCSTVVSRLIVSASDKWISLNILCCDVDLKE